MKKTVADYPKLVEQWHPIKNGDFKPSDFSYGSHKKAWWKCSAAEDHEWEAVIKSRTIGNQGCSCCHSLTTVASNCLSTIYPDVAKEWHLSKNGKLTPFMVTAGSKKKIWWKCPVADDHEWETTVNSRTSQMSGCPFCCGLKAAMDNCLATTHPNLAKEWHPTKNGKLTPFNVTACSTKKKIWWKCPVANDHEWEALLPDRTKTGAGCSCCAGRTIVLSNCLATIHPDVAKEWHPTKNDKLTPFMVSACSGKKIWWKCDKGHEWKCPIHNRASHGSNCPICNESKGEIEISKWLKENNINFKPQQRFNDCKNKQSLPFDFAIELQNELRLIEYQGKHHYSPVDYGVLSPHRALENHNSTVKHDKIKKQYCIDKHIPLLEIPYWDFDKIEVLMKDFCENDK